MCPPDGDFEKNIPEGDTMLLKHIIHDWGDEKAVRILRNCRNALRQGGKVLIMEYVVERDNKPHTANIFGATMLVMQRGKERTEEQYKELLQEAGLKFVRRIQTDPQFTLCDVSIIEAVAA